MILKSNSIIPSFSPTYPEYLSMMNSRNWCSSTAQSQINEANQLNDASNSTVLKKYNLLKSVQEKTRKLEILDLLMANEKTDCIFRIMLIFCKRYRNYYGNKVYWRLCFFYL